MPYLNKEPDPGRSGISPADVLHLVTRDPYKERDWKAALNIPKTFHNLDRVQVIDQRMERKKLV